MAVTIRTDPAVLEHDLNQYFDALQEHESIESVEKSSVFQKIKGQVAEIMNSIVIEDFREEESIPADPKAIKALAWNIERGRFLDAIIDKLKNHSEMKNREVLLFTELDYGMARSHNKFVAQEIAKNLKLSYAFAPVYIALQKGSGVESEVKGENKNSIHGLALFSKYEMTNVHAVALPNGKDKMIGKEKRLGYLRAIIADIKHPHGTFRAVAVHLDVHCSRQHREDQVALIVRHLERLPRLPTIIGGDFNTTTYNAQNATRAILGFWRRVLMGVDNVVKNHYPYPDRYFERGLFSEFEDYGYAYKSFNEPGVGTLHYDMENSAYNTNLGDWVPKWCFPFIFWASRKVGGKFSLRLDWFFGRRIEVAPESKPITISNLNTEDGTQISDHDAIALDFVLSKS